MRNVLVGIVAFSLFSIGLTVGRTSQWHDLAARHAEAEAALKDIAGTQRDADEQLEEIKQFRLELAAREEVLAIAFAVYAKMTGVAIQIGEIEHTVDGEAPPATLFEPLLREHVEPVDPDTPPPAIFEVPAELGRVCPTCGGNGIIFTGKPPWSDSSDCPDCEDGWADDRDQTI